MTIVTCLMPRNIKGKLVFWGQERLCPRSYGVLCMSFQASFWESIIAWIGEHFLFSFGFSDVKELSQQELVWKTMHLQIEMLSMANWLFAHTSSLKYCCSLVYFCSKVQIVVIIPSSFRKRGQQDRSIYNSKCCNCRARLVFIALARRQYSKAEKS